MQQGVQTDAICSIQWCWELLANNVASICTWPNTQEKLKSKGYAKFWGGKQGVFWEMCKWRVVNYLNVV